MKLYGDTIVVDDFFSPDAILAIEDNNYEKINYSDQRGAGICSRIQAEIECPIIDAELGDWLASTEVRRTVRDWADLSWRYVWNELITGADIYLSRYTPNSTFDWHVDHWNRRAVLNWIVTLSGYGVLEWSRAPMEGTQLVVGGVGYHHTSLVMKPNTLIVMPSYYPHRLTMGEDERVSLHGHFNVER